MRKSRPRWDKNAHRRQTETPYLMILFKSTALEFENVKLSAQDIRIECVITGSVDVGHMTPCSCFHQIKYDYILGAFSPILCGSFNLSSSFKNALSKYCRQQTGSHLHEDELSLFECSCI